MSFASVMAVVADGSPEDRRVLEAEHRLETPRAAGVAGLVFSALFVISMVLIRERPAPGSSAAQIADFYLRERWRAGHARRRLPRPVCRYRLPLVHRRYQEPSGRTRGSLLRNRLPRKRPVVRGDALRRVGLRRRAPRVREVPGPASPDADTFLLARSLGFAFLFIFAVRAAAVFMLVASTIGLRTGFLPRWLVVVGYVGGLVFLFSVTYIELLVLIFPAWVIAVSVVILGRGGTQWQGTGPGQPE